MLLLLVYIMNKISIYEANLRFIAYGSHPFVFAKEHNFLKKYFKTKIQKVFLQYYYTFGDSKNFTDHTGYLATRSFLSKMANKFEWLMGEYQSAKYKLDMENLAKLQAKKISVLKKYR